MNVFRDLQITGERDESTAQINWMTQSSAICDWVTWTFN